MVSPFENPFPTRGRGPWTPMGAADSRGCFRIPSTGRDAPTASCSVMRDYWHRMAFCVQTKTFATPESQRLTLSRPLPRHPDILMSVIPTELP